MVSYAKSPRIPQIAFQVRGELQKSLPIRLEDFSQEVIEKYMTALCQDCEAFQGRAFYADHILPGYHIRYDDMAKGYLNGLILPEKSSHVPGHPEQYMQNSVFSFVIILEKGDVVTDISSPLNISSKKKRYPGSMLSSSRFLRLENAS